MVSDYYSGSKLLIGISEKIGLRIDQCNFVACQLVALCCAIIMRKYLHPANTSSTTRHIFSFVIGFCLTYFCFGYQVINLFILATISAFIGKFNNINTLQKKVFILAMGYLALMHIKRMLFNYGVYMLDITGPFMLMTQRVSSLAFSIHDGMVFEESKVTPFRKKYMIKRMPTLPEYLGYVFQFQCILVGPFVFFKDYIDFIEGTIYKVDNKNSSNDPCPMPTVMRKIIQSIICAIIYLSTSGTFSIKRATEKSFIEDWDAFSQIIYLIVSTTLTRTMYYHAWLMAEAVCNASGLGFSGYDQNGKSKWDSAQNVDILGVEGADTLRQAIASWNKGTNIWLRFIAYERLHKHQTLATFVLSAIWHGFYPGYYLCFIGGALLISASRMVRKYIRPCFLVGGHPTVTYNIMTFIVTKLALSYITYPFVMYEFWPAFFIYKRLYFYLHLLAILCLTILPAISNLLPKSAIETQNRS